MSGAGLVPQITLPDPAETADVRLVVVDMDGTLLDGQGRLPDEAWAVIAALRDRGITFTPASGRQYASLRKEFDRASEGMVFLSENGAYVVRDDVELVSSPIEEPIIREAVELARAAEAGHADCGVVLCGKRSAYVERTDRRFIEAAIPYYYELERVPDLLAPGGPLERDSIVKVANYDIDDAERNLAPVMQQLEGRARVVLSSHHWVDVMANGVNKGVALRQLQRALGVTREQTMVFGDYRNDLEMLAEARFAIAMANAHPDVLAASTHVAPPNTDLGVMRALDFSLDLGLGLGLGLGRGR